MLPTKKNTKILTWSQNVQDCYSCPISHFCGPKVLYRTNLTHYQKRTDGYKVDYLFVGEAPGQSEHGTGEPFVGPAGDELNIILEEALSPKSKYIITNSILCTPFTDESLSKIRAPEREEVDNCSIHLKNLISMVKPKLVVALGQVGSRALKKLKVKHLTLLHPSSIMQSLHRNYHLERAIMKLRNYK